MDYIIETLKPTGKYKENLRSYYTVNYKGSEYNVPMYQFQKESGGLPKELRCMIKTENRKTEIIQDRSAIIDQIYKIGEVYTFRVNQTGSNFVNVCDGNGFIFHMIPAHGVRIKDGQLVMARVNKIEGHHMWTDQIVSSTYSDHEMRFYSIDQLAEKLEVSQDARITLTHFMERAESFRRVAELYKDHDGEWLLETIVALDNMILSNVGYPGIDSDFLELFKRLCIFTLEESNLLTKVEESRRRNWINRLAMIAQHGEDYLFAFSLISNGEQGEYFDKQLQNLKESENLYQPERKFRIMMCLFNRDENLMKEMTDKIFDIILKGNKSHWGEEPFRTAFVNMLELFICQYRDKAIRSTDSKLRGKVITAIAIQLLLANNDDDIDYNLNRATYLRLLSYVNTYGSERILDEAFNVLFTSKKIELEYTWEDIYNMDKLYSLAANISQTPAHSYPSTTRPEMFQDSVFRFRVNQDGVSFVPATISSHPYTQRPSLPWKNVTFVTNEEVRARLRSSDTFPAAVAYWNELKDALVQPHNQNRIKSIPSKGDLVRIRIVEESESLDSLDVEIDDDIYRGRGWLDYEKICKYMRNDASKLHFFRNPDGSFKTFDAIVEEEDERGKDILFTLIPLIEDEIIERYPNGTLTDCLVKDADRSDRNTYIGVNDKGFSCRIKVPSGQSLDIGSVVIAATRGLNRYGQIETDYQANSPLTLTTKGVFQALVNLFAVEDDSVVEEQLSYDQMSFGTISEIVGILDRKAVLTDNRSYSYGFLTLAELLSKLMHQNGNEKYYSKRKKLLEQMYDYETNGYVDDKKLESLMNEIGEDVINSDYQLNETMSKFQILKSLRHKDNIDSLFELRNTAHNNSIRDAASLAISILLTDRFEIPNVHRLLEDKINQVLGFKVRSSRLKDYGIETQTMEFKSSIIYPAGTMHPDRNYQGAVIMKTICGFLNSDEGGILYMGVNKNGAACGVDEDMKFLGTDQDGYGRYIHNYINREMGAVANQCCTSCQWIEDEGYKVYQINIRPASTLVKFQGQYWIRQDTETRILPSEEVEQFEKMHRQAYERYLRKSSKR